jgi:HAD superfamily hydrolase (TIGR01509 family)
MGISKPHSKFYRHILDAEGVNPEDAVFIDDFEVNVRAAERLGIRAVLFKNAERLRSEIQCP